MAFVSLSYEYANLR